MDIKKGMVISIMGAVIACIGFFAPWVSGFFYGFKFEMSGFDMMKYLGDQYPYDTSLIIIELIVSLIGLGFSFVYRRFAAIINTYVSIIGVAIPFFYISSLLSANKGYYIGEGLVIEIIGFIILITGSIYNIIKITEDKIRDSSSSKISTVHTPTPPPPPPPSVGTKYEYETYENNGTNNDIVNNDNLPPPPP